MAKAPPHPESLGARYGPNPNYVPPGGWQKGSASPPDHLVKTHCCFCGQQCGIQLKVRDNQVVGFEPVALPVEPVEPVPVDSHGGVKGKRKSKKDKLREAAAAARAAPPLRRSGQR